MLDFDISSLPEKRFVVVKKVCCCLAVVKIQFLGEPFHSDVLYFWPKETAISRLNSSVENCIPKPKTFSYLHTIPKKIMSLVTT